MLRYFSSSVEELNFIIGFLQSDGLFLKHLKLRKDLVELLLLLMIFLKR
jgi:hypothetical protein